MDWYKNYRFLTAEEGKTSNWNNNFNFFGRRLNESDFKIDCNITEEEFINGDSFKLYYGVDFRDMWSITISAVVLDIVRIRKEKLNKLDGLV
jgi:hypothetical protein